MLENDEKFFVSIMADTAEVRDMPGIFKNIDLSCAGDVRPILRPMVVI